MDDYTFTGVLLMLIMIGCIAAAAILKDVAGELCERDGGFIVDHGCRAPECVQGGNR